MPGSGGTSDERLSGPSRVRAGGFCAPLRAALVPLLFLLLSASAPPAPAAPPDRAIFRQQNSPAVVEARPAEPLPPEVAVMQAGPVEVVYWPPDRAMAERTLRAASARLRLPGIAVSSAPPAARVVLAPTPSAFDSITRGAPHWSAGIAIPSERLIVLPGYSSGRTPMGDPLVALRHELVHIALNGHLPGRIPRWFDEGYATWASGEWDAGRGWEIRLALLGGGVPPLDSLRLGWPGAEADARLAYLLSASAVTYLAGYGGDEAFAAFFSAWRREGDFDSALRNTYGMTLTQFEEEWRGMVKRRYGWLLALSQMGVVWALVAVLLVLLTFPRRRRNREKLRKMEVDEWVEAWADEVEDEQVNG